MLYRNTGGRFTDVTSRAGLNLTQDALGCTAGDYDNDGRDDLAIGLADGIAVYRNQGNGTFRDVTTALGIRVSGISLGVSFIDYDHDGDLDLYVPRMTDFALGPNGAVRLSFDGGARLRIRCGATTAMAPLSDATEQVGTRG